MLQELPLDCRVHERLGGAGAGIQFLRLGVAGSRCIEYVPQPRARITLARRLPCTLMLASR
jgi:hypothetical protein